MRFSTAITALMATTALAVQPLKEEDVPRLRQELADVNPDAPDVGAQGVVDCFALGAALIGCGLLSTTPAILACAGASTVLVCGCAQDLQHPGWLDGFINDVCNA